MTPFNPLTNQVKLKIRFTTLQSSEVAMYWNEKLLSIQPDLSSAMNAATWFTDGLNVGLEVGYVYGLDHGDQHGCSGDYNDMLQDVANA